MTIRSQMTGVTLIEIGDLMRREQQRIETWRDVLILEGKHLARQQARDLAIFEAADRLIERLRSDSVILDRLRAARAQ